MPTLKERMPTLKERMLILLERMPVLLERIPVLLERIPVLKVRIVSLLARIEVLRIVFEAFKVSKTFEVEEFLIFAKELSRNSGPFTLLLNRIIAVKVCDATGDE
jgi:hypothetical protein